MTVFDVFDSVDPRSLKPRDVNYGNSAVKYIDRVPNSDGSEIEMKWIDGDYSAGCQLHQFE